MTDDKKAAPEIADENNGKKAIIETPTEPQSDAGEKNSSAEKKAPKGRKKKSVRSVPVGNAYIKATYNNTIVTLTDQAGNMIAFSSAGANGFKGPKKATPYAASVIVREAVNKAKPYGLKDVNVFVRGVGMGRESAVRSLNANGLNVLSIKDVTPVPHNGCRRRKPRKV